MLDLLLSLRPASGEAIAGRHSQGVCEKSHAVVSRTSATQQNKQFDRIMIVTRRAVHRIDPMRLANKASSSFLRYLRLRYWRRHRSLHRLVSPTLQD
jgi:hypothetical protein